MTKSTALTHLLLMSGMCSTLWSCSSDPITTVPDRTEEYNRAFIKEFGTFPGRNLLDDCIETSLEIVSKEDAYIKVYYKNAGEDGEERNILVGDLTIYAGREEVPFVLPSEITILYVEARGEEFAAPVGGSVNIDEPQGRSRGIATDISNASGSTVISYDPSSVESRTIMFTTDQMKRFFDRLIPGEDNLYPKTNDTQYLKLKYGIGIETKFISKDTDPDSFRYVRNVKSKPYIMIPVYWATSGSGVKASEMELGIGLASDANFLSGESYGDSHYLAFHEAIGPDVYANAVTADDAIEAMRQVDVESAEVSYPHDSTEPYTIMTHGVKIDNDRESLYMGMEYLRQYFGKGYSASDEHRGLVSPFWNFNLHTENDYTKYRETCVLYGSYYTFTNGRLRDKRPLDESEYFTYKQLVDGQWIEKKSMVNFLAFSYPQVNDIYEGYELADERRPDFCNVVYLIIPEDDNDVLYVEDSGYGYLAYSPYTFAAEDLGGTYDWDFNDAVFEVNWVTKNAEEILYSAVFPGQTFRTNLNASIKRPKVYEVTVTPKAAGGTMPIYIAYHGQYAIAPLDEPAVGEAATYNDAVKLVSQYKNDETKWSDDAIWVVGSELHNWLGANTHARPINVGEKVTHKGCEVKFYVKTDATIGGNSNNNKPLGNFSVIVDPDNRLGISTTGTFTPQSTGAVYNALTRFNGELGTAYEIGSLKENSENAAPQMVMFRATSWKWPKEEIKITTAYPQFVDYLSGQSNTWHNSSNAIKDYIIQP